MNQDILTPHSDYTVMLSALIQNEDALKGSKFVKDKGQLYLPHPSAVDKHSEEAKMRYAAYLAGAEFDDTTQATLRAWLGKLKIDDTVIELPERLSYLVNDVDRDGLSMVGLINSCAANVFAYKYHALVVDYQGLTDLDTEQVSKADLDVIRPRATIKQYERKNIIDWSYSRINGIMQLTSVILREVSDNDNLTQTKTESFIKLALDENGNYYQQKLVRNASSDGLSESEPSYVLVGGSPLKWLPVLFVSDEELQAGCLPMRLGMLTPIVDLTMSRYRVSADYKESMRQLVPTTHFFGLDEHSWKTFQGVNGRSYVAQGGVNLWDKAVEIKVVSSDSSLEQYEKYFESNEKKIRAAGGVFPNDDKKQRTATEVIAEAESDNARFAPLVSSIEECLKRAILYCGMFEGLYSQDAIEQNIEQVTIEMNKDFTVSKLAVEEVKALGELVVTGLYPRDEFAKMLVKGGWSVSSVDDLLNSLESSNI